MKLVKLIIVLCPCPVQQGKVGETSLVLLTALKPYKNKVIENNLSNIKNYTITIEIVKRLFSCY